MNTPKLGSGKRFKNLANKFAKKGINDPAALAAKVGISKWGKSRMEKMAEAGKKRHEREKEEGHGY
jgi:hypothetical protein